MQIDLTQLIIALVGIAVTVLTGYLIPLVKSKTTADAQATIQFWTTIAVNAAEQIYKEPGLGATKKQYVLQFLRQKGFHVDEASLDNLIESAVLQLKQALSDQSTATQ